MSSRWVAVAVAGVLAGSGCKRGVHSQGACEGAVGATDVGGALSEASVYQVDWTNATSPVKLQLDCGGQLRIEAEMTRIPTDGAHQWALTGADPATRKILAWSLLAPKSPPRLTAGTFDASHDSLSARLNGKAEMRFEDGTAAAIRFSLDPGQIPAPEMPANQQVSAIPGRIKFESH